MTWRAYDDQRKEEPKAPSPLVRLLRECNGQLLWVYGFQEITHDYYGKEYFHPYCAALWLGDTVTFISWVATIGPSPYEHEVESDRRFEAACGRELPPWRYSMDSKNPFVTGQRLVPHDHAHDRWTFLHCDACGKQVATQIAVGVFAHQFHDRPDGTYFGFHVFHPECDYPREAPEDLPPGAVGYKPPVVDGRRTGCLAAVLYVWWIT